MNDISTTLNHMKVLVIGGGGREHSLVWKIKQSPLVKKIYCAPGNAGIADLAEVVAISADDISGLVNFAQDNQIDLTIVGPEAPLVAGIVDEFERKGLRIFGPNKIAAQLEGSKAFAKELMREHGIPTAEFEVFDDYEEARNYLSSLSYPKVIKADGLCAGKGSIIVENEGEAQSTLYRIMKEKVFGSSGDKVIIEEYLEGEEASIIAISDGENIVLLASSQDHKRVYDGDQGPNTGGMGAYSPAPIAEGQVTEVSYERILKATINALRDKGITFKGVLYAGIMVSDGKPYVLEFNVRFGDPETQAILPRMEDDLLELILASIEGRLADYKLKWKEKSCICVVLASGGYPGKYEKGKLIQGLERLASLDDVLVFHAGTKAVIEDGRKLYYTNGGRVLNVVALGNDLKVAQKKAYQAIELINFDGMHYRRDIGNKAFKWLEAC